MANVSYRTDKVLEEEVKGRNATAESVLQHISGAVNYCLDKSLLQYVDTFTSNGSWVCPAGVTRVFVYGCGGGGGGQSGPIGIGGGASVPHLVALTVAPTTSYAITIGGGGTGGTGGAGASGSNGGDTSFGTLYKFPGGVGGYVVPNSFYQIPGGYQGQDGPSFSIYQGGVSIQNPGNSTHPFGAGGGASSLGSGGQGAYLLTGAAQAGSGFGSGGGGGYNLYGSPPTYPNGGTGASGVLYVIYFKSNI